MIDFIGGIAAGTMTGWLGMMIGNRERKLVKRLAVLFAVAALPMLYAILSMLLSSVATIFGAIIGALIHQAFHISVAEQKALSD
ncbi:MAG: hypothetical protein ABIL58_12880 [Pseudomonadota bacterium]